MKKSVNVNLPLIPLESTCQSNVTKFKHKIDARWSAYDNIDSCSSKNDNIDSSQQKMII